MRPYPVPGCEVFSPLQEGKKKDSNFSYLSMVMRLTFSTKETTWPVILHETLRDLLPVSLVVPVSGGKNILLATCTSLMRATLALITLSCYNWFTCLSFKSLYVPFHTGDDDVLASTSQWLVLPRRKLASTNQKHYPDLGSDMSSVWNSALISQNSFCGENSGVVWAVLSGFLFKFNAWGSVFGFNTGICVRALGPFVVSSHLNNMKCLCKDCWVSKTCSVLKFSFLCFFGHTGKPLFKFCSCIL